MVKIEIYLPNNSEELTEQEANLALTQIMLECFERDLKGGNYHE